MKFPVVFLSVLKKSFRYFFLVLKFVFSGISIEQFEKILLMSRKLKVNPRETCVLKLTIYYVDGSVSEELLPVQQAEYRFSLICGAFCHSVTTKIDRVDVSDGRGMLLSRFSVLKHNLVCS